MWCPLLAQRSCACEMHALKDRDAQLSECFSTWACTYVGWQSHLTLTSALLRALLLCTLQAAAATRSSRQPSWRHHCRARQLLLLLEPCPPRMCPC